MGCLVRFEPVSTATFKQAERGKVDIASAAVLRKIQDFMREKDEESNYRLFRAVRGIPAFQTFRAYFMEGEAHRCFERLQCVQVQLLGTADVRKVNFPELKRVRFSHMDMLDLTQMSADDYVTPTISNFPSVDSFAALDKSLFDDRGRGKALAMFQITVSDDHSVRGPDLENVHDRVCLLLGVQSLPVLLVYVTTPDGVRAPQNILNEEGHVYARVPAFVKGVKQYALLLGGRFEEYANGWKVAQDANLR